MRFYNREALAVFFALCLFFCMASAAFGAPADQTFDSAGVGDKGTQSYTLDGVTYTTNDGGGLNINIVNDGNIASGGDLALGYRSSGVDQTTQVTFGTSDGSEFKLNSFVISTGLGDTTVTIKGYRDNSEVASDSVTTASFTTFNVFANSNWEYIDEVRMTGADLDIDIDDIDFSPGVPPTHTVTYNGNTNTGGSVPTDGNSYINGDTVTVLGNTGSLVKTGYTFAGWNTAANGSGTSYTGGDTFSMGASNVTMYAQWTAVDYTVTYNGNTNTGGSVPVDGNTYNITNTVTVLGNTGSLVKTGYTFSGWNTAANGSGTSYNGGDTFAMGSSSVTLYAQWTENTYTVTYNGNGNTGGAVPTDATSYHNGDTATVLGNTGSLVRTGYTFAGWNTAANGSGTSYTGGDTFGITTSNVTLYAQWTAVDYTVTYNGNTNTGGSVPVDGNTYNITNTVTVLGNTGSLVKTGYTFSGWNTAANGSGTSYNGGDTFAMGSSSVTLYAQWTENTYTVTYNGNGNTGGAVPTDATSYHNGDTATVLGNTGSLVRTGYTFAGWNTAANGSGTSYTGGDTFGITTSDVTLYAQWTAVDYTVTYNGNGHTGGSVPVDGNTYNITDIVTVLGNTGSLVRTGYTFSGWNTAANGGGTSYNGGDTFAMGSSNVTLYAQWTENTYTVTYNGNGNTGGSVPTDATSYHNGDTATVLGNTGSLVRTGYTFAGWNTAANGSGTSYTGGDTFGITTSDVTLYAQWTAVDYTVTYNGNGHTGGSVPVDGNTYNITDIVTVLGNTGSLVRTGYIFEGWNMVGNGSVTLYKGGDTFSMGGANVILSARWIAKSDEDHDDSGNSDFDNVSDSEEQGPNGHDTGYDGNGDGTPDWLQDNVTSLPSADDESYITLSAPEGASFTRVEAKEVPAALPGPEDSTPSTTYVPNQAENFPVGLLSFTILTNDVGADLEVTIRLPEGQHAAGYYKYGPTPDNPTPHWYEFLYDGSTGAEIFGNIIVLHFIDGQRGDDDLTSDGVINDDGGPVVYQTAICFPHFAISGDWQSDVKIVNLENYQERVQINFYGEDGEALERMDLLLDAKMSYNIKAPENTASAMLEGDGRLVGWTTFTNAGGGSDVMPTVSQTSKKIIVPHIASSSSWWTGLAFANMNAEAATVTVNFDNHEQYQFNLPPHGHHAFCIGALGQNFQGATGASVTSDLEISGLLIYGEIPQGGGYGDIATLALGMSAENLFVPAINEASDWAGIGIYNRQMTEMNLTGEVFEPSQCSIEHDFGFLAGGEHTAFDIQESLGTSKGAAVLQGSINQCSLFGNAQVPIDGIVLWGDAAGVGGYNLAGNGFTKGIVPLLSNDDALYLFNPCDKELSLHYEAFTSTGTMLLAGSFNIPAGTNSMTNIEDIAGTDADYLLLSAERTIYGHLQGKNEDVLKVLPVVGY